MEGLCCIALRAKKNCLKVCQRYFACARRVVAHKKNHAGERQALLLRVHCCAEPLEDRECLNGAG